MLNPTAAVKRLLYPIRSKILLMIGRAVLQEVYNTDGTMKIKVKGLKGETNNNIDRLEDYGFTHYPPIDDVTENLVLYIGGDRNLGIAIKAHNKNYRPKDLKEGEVCVYDKNNVRIWIKTDKSINFKNATAINMLGATEQFVNGTTFDAWLTSLKTWLQTHIHPTPAGPTTLPITPAFPSGPTGHLSTKIKGE